MDPCWLDVLHDAHDAHLIPITNGVGLAFDGPVQKVIEQNLVAGHVPQNLHHVMLQVFFVDDNFHALSSQHVRWTHQKREAQIAAEFHGLICALHHAKLGVRNALFFQQ